MKRIKRVLFMLLFAVLLLPLRAQAASAATRLDYTATINVDGEALVSLTLNLHLEAINQNLTYPLPGTATNITVNGASPATNKSGSLTIVSLARVTGGQPGDYVVTISYSLPKVVTVAMKTDPLNKSKQIVDKDNLKLELPLLSGFAYPISAMNYTITLPGEFTSTPDFYSTYQQNGLASELNLLYNGNMLTGSSKSGFNDHESVYMTMTLPPDMFPGVSTYQRTGNPELVPMGILAGTALLYWLLFLRTFPARRESCTIPPEGITAGELDCRLFLKGADLTTMVLCWAQLGYILIQVDGRRVLLHKRMDMGNERSLFEVRTFRSLFGDRRVVDASSLAYAKTLRKARGMVPGESAICHSNERKRNIYRYILCVSQVFCGICMAMNMTSILALQILLSLLFGALAVVTAWQLHKVAYCTIGRDKTGLITAGVSLLVWLIIGLIAKAVWIPLAECAGQILLGFPAAWGGRRSEVNRHEVAQLRGLRHYLSHMPAEDVQRLLAADSSYYFRMAPYAMALGVLHPFTLAFGKRKLPQCPYIVTRVQGSRKAEDWETLLKDLTSRMDARAKRMEMDRWLAVRFR